jgi:Rrf2 family protein
MDVIRRNTDYALRLIAGLAINYGGEPIPARQLAKEQDVSEPIACKLLQKLSAAKLVKSSMGAAGGFELAREPKKINLYDVISTIQGDVCFSQCVVNAKSCPHRPKCQVSKKLSHLQKYIEESLKETTLDKLINSK